VPPPWVEMILTLAGWLQGSSHMNHILAASDNAEQEFAFDWLRRKLGSTKRIPANSEDACDCGPERPRSGDVLEFGRKPMKTSSLFVAGLAFAILPIAPANAEKNKKPASYADKKPASYAECKERASKQGWGYNATWYYCQEYKN
jgi:hypothetical protein